MREVKFRAWDKVNEMWLKITGFETHVLDDGKTASINKGLGGMFHDGDYIGTFQKHAGEQNNVTLIQYTGLKDVNGVEIYEGDIVKNIGPHSPTIRKYGFGEFRYIDENLVVCKELVGTTLRHVVDFKCQLESPNGLNGMSPNGWHGPKPPIDNEQFWNYQRSFEVIGNIFENPELLEVNK